MTAPLLTAAELAEHLRLSPNTVQLWARQRRIPGRKIGSRVVNGRQVGGRWRFDQDEVDSELARHDPWAPPQRGRRAS